MKIYVQDLVPRSECRSRKMIKVKTSRVTAKVTRGSNKGEFKVFIIGCCGISGGR